MLRMPVGPSLGCPDSLFAVEYCACNVFKDNMEERYYSRRYRFVIPPSKLHNAGEVLGKELLNGHYAKASY